MTPLLGLTVGDPAGIGPEVTLKAAGDPRIADVRLVAIGSLEALRAAAAVVADAPALHAVATPAEARFEPGTLDVIAVPSDVAVPVGKLSAEAGQIAFEGVERAVALALAGEIDGIVTAPLNKEAIALAGHPYPGHTEILADLTGTTDFAMMLTALKLRVVHVTTHVGIRQMLERVTTERVLTTIRLADRALRDMGIDEPSVGVAGLNPHAGEGGLFGDEEAQVIIPAIEQAKAEGIAASGPWPADTLFGRAVAGDFDVAIAMFHDQGHIAVKVLGFETGVNATIGLPIVRTSVDHGTAFDIAGTGRASADSLVEAITVGAAMAKARAAART
ncbi:4-hydroxythreonine-4-phosphate dehydrogenase PdxA [Pseudonocardia xinjiangensis]|uniref:4-hydroxythreonine-4-phosphate dehydrogenase PdxA n=1 Tax=Pseudonocardia xinjiangensis TaxID=75289 RepID=A0ABX1RCW0_9PSEU|nr:4-hydroxythreonine-4-phosphate dehydrogenase PdxA [Pseudonocardia xinjiangensis]NMH78228.1 4-hydroxythreonine-4-phosphate dehydrogenase PdxA [Pseudonocardia xinjiangensis]